MEGLPANRRPGRRQDPGRSPVGDERADRRTGHWWFRNSASSWPTSKGRRPSSSRTSMPRIPIFKLGGSSEELIPPALSSYTAIAVARGLAGRRRQPSPRRTSQSQVHRDRARPHCAPDRIGTATLRGYLPRKRRRLCAPNPVPQQVEQRVEARPEEPNLRTSKAVLTELHVGALNRAKAENKVAIDLLRPPGGHQVPRAWN